MTTNLVLLIGFGLGIAVVTAAVTVMVLRERRRHAELCGDLRPQLLPFSDRMARRDVCVLPHGHESRHHQSADGIVWREHVARPAEES